jgi:hypothetical protein
MNYLKIYCKLVRKAETRNWKRKDVSFPIELHHIFPISMYGKNNRIVALTPREHYIAHMLLYKICLSRYGIKNNKTFKMGSAFAMMCINSKVQGRAYTARQYETARNCLSRIRTGKSRDDLKGKKYFGASEESIQIAIEKMRKKKTGMKINYPKNRKSLPCSESRAKNVSEARKKTKFKFIDMSEEEFNVWMSKQNLYRKNGTRNANVTRVLMWRNIPLEIYYGNKIR